MIRIYRQQHGQPNSCSVAVPKLLLTHTWKGSGGKGTGQFSESGGEGARGQAILQAPCIPCSQFPGAGKGHMLWSCEYMNARFSKGLLCKCPTHFSCTPPPLLQP